MVFVSSGSPISREIQILLLDEQIIDYRIRYEICQELAEDGDSHRYLGQLPPKTEDDLEEFDQPTSWLVILYKS